MTTARRIPRLPYAVRTERRLSTPRWLPAATTLGAVMVALAISGLLIAAIGSDPIVITQHILRTSIGSPGAISDTLVKATPLIFTGLACALAFRMRLWNIGAEGQLYLGAWGAAAVVLVPIVPAGSSPFVVVPVMLVAGIAAGALWAGHRRLAQGPLQCQRDHHHPDAQLHRYPVDPVLGVRAVERWGLPAHQVIPPGGLAHAAHRLCQGVPGASVA